jgi:hypothetical protein
MIKRRTLSAVKLRLFPLIDFTERCGVKATKLAYFLDGSIISSVTERLLKGLACDFERSEEIAAAKPLPLTSFTSMRFISSGYYNVNA